MGGLPRQNGKLMGGERVVNTCQYFQRLYRSLCFSPPPPPYSLSRAHDWWILNAHTHTHTHTHTRKKQKPQKSLHTIASACGCHEADGVGGGGVGGRVVVPSQGTEWCNQINCTVLIVCYGRVTAENPPHFNLLQRIVKYTSTSFFKGYVYDNGL